MSKQHLSKFTSAYLHKFFEKKNLPVEQWEININGKPQLINSTQIIQQILSASPNEQIELAEALRELDANNHDINTFLKHLAMSSH
ncbi:MAG: hypothetical protein OEY87_10485 [Gammaproteobacteria bacterium]|nr:hypothetical protein [Gammaproteobacteria bacterium]MDH5736536.1 hypothetical protein [Gammaproteobacteria bacterium]